MPAFVDTNVFGYLIGDGRKERVARQIALASPHISVQVLNEFIAVCRKSKKDLPTAYRLANTLASACTVHGLTVTTFRLAQTFATTHQVSHWDALILAAANIAQCDTLYSEDLQHGQKIGGLTIVNPFLSAA